MDRGRTKQKALLMMILRQIMIELSITHGVIALGQLCIGAIFFAMRSCEYIRRFHQEDSKRTKVVSLKNIRLKKDGK